MPPTLPHQAPPPPAPPGMGGGRIELAPDEAAEAVTSFFGLEGPALALKSEGFTPEELFRRLVQHSRDPDPLVSLAALDKLNRFYKERAVLAGHIAQAKITQTQENTDADGNTTRTQAQALTSRLRTAGRPALPQRGAGGAPFGGLEFLAPAQPRADQAPAPRGAPGPQPVAPD